MIPATKCAFHTSENIVNFCRSQGCFLPLCPTCIRVHSEEHRQESTYGDFENINTVAGEIQYNIHSLDKLLESIGGDFAEINQAKKRVELDLRKNIAEAKVKMMQQIERYFQDIESALSKSITHYNEVTMDDLQKVSGEILELRRQLKCTSDSLATDRSLKTVITYFLEDELTAWKNEIKKIETQLSCIKEQSSVVEVDSNIITEVMDKLDQYIGISFENYEEKGFYAKEYSKAKNGSTSRVRTINND